MLNQDRARDDRFQWQGYQVLRFDNEAILKNIDGVLAVVLASLGAGEGVT